MNLSRRRGKEIIYPFGGFDREKHSKSTNIMLRARKAAGFYKFLIQQIFTYSHGTYIC